MTPGGPEELPANLRDEPYGLSMWLVLLGAVVCLVLGFYTFVLAPAVTITLLAAALVLSYAFVRMLRANNNVWG